MSSRRAQDGDDYDDDGDGEEEVMPTPSRRSNGAAAAASAAASDSPPTRGRGRPRKSATTRNSTRNEEEQEEEEESDEDEETEGQQEYDMRKIPNALASKSLRLGNVVDEIEHLRNEHDNRLGTILKELDKIGQKQLDTRNQVDNVDNSEEIKDKLMQSAEKVKETEEAILKERFHNDNPFHVAKVMTERHQKQTLVQLKHGPYRDEFREIPFNGNTPDLKYLNQKYGLEIASRLISVKEGDDIVVEQGEDTEATFRCPCTQRLMQTPMKTPCGHHIDRTSLTVVFSNYGQGRCPYPGCGKNLRKQDVAVDHEMSQRIERWRQRQATQPAA